MAEDTHTSRVVPRPGACVIDAFDRAERRRNLSPRTIYTRRRLLDGLATWADRRESHILGCCSEDIEQWLDSCQISGPSRATYLASVRAFYRWCVDAGHLATNPTDVIARPKTGKGLPHPIATEDLATAMAASTGAMRAWLCLGAFQGFRCIEIAGLQRGDVRDCEDPSRLLARGKGAKDRVVPLHPSTLRAIHAADLPVSGPLFRLENGRPISAATLATYVARHFRSLGIRSSAHELRHWFATRLYEATRDLLLVQELMGHENAETTRIYTKLVANKSAVNAVLGLKV